MSYTKSWYGAILGVKQEVTFPGDA